jgi:hypothetical protein
VVIGATSPYPKGLRVATAHQSDEKIFLNFSSLLIICLIV